MNNARMSILALAATLGMGGMALAQEGYPGGTTGADTGATITRQQQGAMQGGMLASRFIGSTVYSNSGETIGEINDIVLQPQSGQIVTAVVGVGGFLGIGEKDVAIDMAQLQLQPQEGGGTPRLILNTTKEALNNAPSFDRNMLMDESDDTATGSTGTGGAGGTVPSQQPQQPLQPQQPQ